MSQNMKEKERKKKRKSDRIEARKAFLLLHLRAEMSNEKKRRKERQEKSLLTFFRKSYRRIRG